MRESFELFHREVNRSSVALLRLELVTQELVDILKVHDCHSVAVESGSERVRNELINRRYFSQLLIDIADRLHKAGIRFRS